PSNSFYRKMKCSIQSSSLREFTKKRGLFSWSYLFQPSSVHPYIGKLAFRSFFFLSSHFLTPCAQFIPSDINTQDGFPIILLTEGPSGAYKFHMRGFPYYVYTSSTSE